MIRCEEGWVNLDYVVRVTRVNEEINGRLQHRYILFGANDQIIGRTAWYGQDSVDFGEIFAPVVPAVAAQTAVVISLSLQWFGGNRPTENGIEARFYPIIG
jgi:hypothetical protein